MTHAAVIGMVLSLFLTGLFSIFAVRLTRLTGFGDENMMFLVQQSPNTLDMRGILLAGIIIGALGVLDDLVVGQSSAVFQLYGTAPDLSMKELYRRAMVIGRDHVAAAVNTLILAYAGESLPMLLLFSVDACGYAPGFKCQLHHGGDCASAGGYDWIVFVHTHCDFYGLLLGQT